MKKISKKDFLADVEHEIRSLKENASPEELYRLNLNSFDPRSQYSCIYGQMTGSCRSQRAKNLMDKSCVRVLHNITGVDSISKKQFKEVSDKINGSYEGQPWDYAGIRTYRYLSALEGYICLKGAKISNIISFLKGERDDLKL